MVAPPDRSRNRINTRLSPAKSGESPAVPGEGGPKVGPSPCVAGEGWDSGGAALLVAEVVDVLGGGHCGSGAVTDRRRYLLGELGAHVADRPDARDGCLHVAVRDQIPRRLVLDVGPQQLGVGQEADEDEDASHREVPLDPVLDVAQPGDRLVAVDLGDLGVQEELDLGIGAGTRLQDRLGGL